MFCIKCGAQLTDDVLVCDACGTDLNEEVKGVSATVKTVEAEKVDNNIRNYTKYDTFRNAIE